MPRIADTGSQITKDHLLDHAAKLFAERGFQKVTVREISVAVGSNVAAVNYHFGDKMGLYREIVERALVLMEETTNTAKAAGRGASPEEQLRAFIHIFVERLSMRQTGNYIQGIMMREMEDPTPMLDVIASRVMEPRLRYLGGVVGKLLGRRAGDRVVRNCVASIHAQCLMCKNTPALARMKMGFDTRTGKNTGLADHITEFSLNALARMASKSPTRHRRYVGLS